MEFNIAIENYKTYLVVEKALSESSIGAYINDIKKFSEYCTSNDITTIKSVTNDVISGFLEFLKEGKITDRTLMRQISSLSSFFKFMLLEGQVKNNPIQILAPPKVKCKTPNLLTVEEVNSILKAVEISKPEGQRNKAIIEVLYSCGLRVSELINLKLSAINFRSGEIRISGKGNKERLIPLNSQTRQEIKLYIKGYRGYLDIVPGNEDILFLNRNGKPLSRVVVFNIIKYLAIKAGFQKRISPHTFRHTFAYQLISAGTNLITVQNRLGHETLNAIEVYAHITID